LRAANPDYSGQEKLMPQQLAFLLFLVFVLYLFRMDSKRYFNVSYALWIPVIWLLLIGSRPIPLWMNPQLNETAESYLTGNPLLRSIYSILISLGLFILSRRKLHWSHIFKSNLWLFLFFLYCGISILWSDFQYVSLKRWIKVVGHLVMALIILTEPNPVESIKRVFRKSYYILVPLSIVLIRYYPGLGKEFHRWSTYNIGVCYGKNGLGFLSMIGCLFFFWNWQIKFRQKNVSSFDKKENILLLLMSFWLLYKANSATSLLCFISGVCIMTVLDVPVFKNKPQHIGYVILSILFFSLPFLIFGFDSILSTVLDASGHSSTFWGRTELWEDLVTTRTANPLIGTGFESFWL
jgi:O-antigen ligase